MHTARYLKKLAKHEKDKRLKYRYFAIYHFKKSESRTQIARFGLQNKNKKMPL
jgi:hypothetical protein